MELKRSKKKKGKEEEERGNVHLITNDIRIRICPRSRNALIIYQVLSTNSKSECLDISVEKLYLDIGA